MTLRHTLAFSLAVVGIAPGAALFAEERPIFSKHIHDAIVAGFRKGETAIPVFEPAAPLDVEPGIVLLPKRTVLNAPGSGGLSPEVVAPKTEAVPLVLGTGVTEFKGKKFTLLIGKILFIPVGFKLQW